MSFPEELKYTKEHEWVKVDGDTATMGITDFAQSELGELVFVELPEAGKTLNQGETICVVESTKAASDVYSPISGTVSSCNETLNDKPELINESPYENGWMVKVTNFKSEDLNSLMSAEEYGKFINNS